MRKISVILIALTLIPGCASCGSNSSATSDTSSQILTSPTEESVETTTEDEIVEVDPFENVSIDVPDTYYDSNSANIYPNQFLYFLKTDDERMATLFETTTRYDATITEATADIAKVHISLHDYPVSDIEEEYGIKLVPTEQDFIIDVKKYRMSLVSESQLTDKNVKDICEYLKDHIINDIETENGDIDSWNDFAEEWNSDVKSSIDDNLELIKCYVDDFDASSKLDIGGLLENTVYAIFKNNNEQYFLASAMPMFVNEKFEDKFTEYKTHNYIPEEEFNTYIFYPSLDEAEKSIKKSVHEIK